MFCINIIVFNILYNNSNRKVNNVSNYYYFYYIIHFFDNEIGLLNYKL